MTPRDRREPGFRHVGRVALALVLGLAVGLGALRFGGPLALRLVASLEPIGTLWINAIRMTVVPLVVALLLGAVVRTGGGSGIGRSGVVAFGAFLFLHVSAAVLALLAVPPVVAMLGIDPASAARLQADAAARSIETSARIRTLPGFGQWIADLAPANVIGAAADGAMLPLIVFTVMFAMALRRITPDRRQHVLGVFDGIGGAMLAIVRWLIAFAPIGIFTLVAPTAARLGPSIAGALGSYVLAYVGLLMGLVVVTMGLGSLGGRVGLGRYVRAGAPAQAVAFSSSSSLASLPALVDSAGQIGVPTPLAGFVLPLAVSTFKLATGMVWLLAALFLGRLYGVPIGVGDQLTIVASGVALSFATPGVPNAGLLLLAPVLASVGLPAAGVALLIAIDAVPDLFATLANVTGDFAATAIVARRTAMAPVAVEEPAVPSALSP